uniref:(northern house mosquito) hypothetical protein n=1 Tax=Culex pipiens TaxID=7175 RepID=A0A8D8BDE0_CULPI
MQCNCRRAGVQFFGDFNPLFLRVPNGFFRVRSCFHPVVGEVIRVERAGIVSVEIKQSARSVEERSRRWNLDVWRKKRRNDFWRASNTSGLAKEEKKNHG